MPLTPKSQSIFASKLTTLTPDHFKPHLINHHWRKPVITAMQHAKLRQAAKLTGQEWVYDKPRKPVHPVVFKGHKHVLSREAQRQRVIDGLASQPARLQAYYDAMHASRVRNEDILSALTKGKQTLFQMRPKQKTYELKPITDPKYMSKAPLSPQPTSSKQASNVKQ